MQLQVNFAS